MADSVKTFQSHLTSVMDSLVRATVCEITKLFQDTVNDYLVEISLNRKENEALKLRLRLTENKLRNERKYGMGWTASRRSAGLLVSDDSGRKKRRVEIPRVKQRGGTTFGKDWTGNPWEEGGPASGEAGEEARDVYLVQLPGGEEEEEECVAGEREEATNIKEESTDMEGGYRPESLRLIQEALQMDPTDPNIHAGTRIQMEGDVESGAVIAEAGERAPVEQPRCEEEWDMEAAPAEGTEDFPEPHRPRHGVEDLSGLETALKAERGKEHPGQRLGQPGPEHDAEDFGGAAPESVVNSLGCELEYVMSQKYIGLDGMCSSEQEAALQAAPPAERDADGLLEVHARLGPALPHPEVRGFSAGRVKEGLRPLPGVGAELRSGWPKRAREGDGGGADRLAVSLEQAPPLAGGSVGEPAGDAGDFLNFCAQCGSSFGSAADLEDHPCLLSVPNQHHSCAVCGKSFGQPAHLRAHMRLHAGEAGERPYHCAQCGRSFNQSWNLKNHECVQSGERPHRCELCGKRFTHSRSLERHQLVHTGERPHRCPQCGRSFSRLGNLERHQRIHTGERPYACTACGKRFSRVEYLKRHQQIHSGERAGHQCSHCGKAFSEPEQLKTHQCFYNI
ncbi:zinc finger protein 768 [Megalops cyprinoides]|uniref:zinc finger protein 768 n=1 Tax=Megalops cyprinoides TaxID=118141 RepID=UPI001863ADB4|nr:zinc finger protein 768 [Megalops cyprinoides]